MASRPRTPPKQIALSPTASPAMPHITALIGFALVSLGMVLTPGPNMIYLISRSITQGPRPASSRSAASRSASSSTCCARRSASPRCCLRFLTPMTRCGSPAPPISVARVAGAEAGRPLAVPGERAQGRRPAQIVRDGLHHQPAQPENRDALSALLPQFIDPARGSVLTQSLALGSTQIVDQRQRQRDDRVRRRLDRLFLGARPTWLWCSAG